MNERSGLPTWAIGLGVVILALVALQALLHIGAALIGLVFSILGTLISFLFSKAGVLLVSAGLVFYVWNNRGESRSTRYYDGY